MTDRKQSRRRGAILTAVGYQKLQAAKAAAEEAANFGERYTKEELTIITGLSRKTISKIFDRSSDPTPVDKQTLVLCFTAFNLVLERDDYTTPDAIELVDLEWLDPLESVALVPQPPPRPHSNIDWGEAPDISVFYGRVSELTTLTTWVNDSRCRLVMILGMGGVGKTALVTKLASQLQPDFAKIVWRSLRNAPPLDTLLPELIQILCPQADILAPNMEISAQILRLLDCLRQERCLLVFDNAEAMIPSRNASETHRREYAAYTELFERIGASSHQSCLLVTSREKPEQIVSLEGAKLPVRTLTISGLNPSDSEALFDAKGLSASAADRKRLCNIYSGNPLALNIVATSIYNLFDGDIQRFLKTEVSIFDGIRQLLDRQFERLSPAEQTVMYSLAIERNWLSLDDLHARIIPTTTKPRLLSTLESLQRRSLIEQSAGKFTQQAVVMEYMTERTIDRVVRELANWDVETGDCLFTLTEHTGRIWAARFSPNGKLLATCSGDGTIRIWDVATWTVLEILTGFRNWFFAIEFSPDSQFLAIGNVGNVVKIWDLSTKQQIHTLSGHSARVATLQFSTDGRLLVTGSGDRSVRLWDTRTWQELYCWQGYSNWIESVVFHPNGTRLLTGSQDGSVAEWDVQSGRILQTFVGHQLGLWSVNYSPDGKIIVSGSADSTVKVWDAEAGQLLQTLSTRQGDVWCVRFSPDGRFIAGTSMDNLGVCVWLATGALLTTLFGHTNLVRSIAFSPNSQLLATGSFDCSWRLWDVGNSQMLGCYTGHDNWIWDLAWSSDGEFIATGSADCTARLWRATTGELLQTFKGHTLGVVAVKFSPNDRYLATGSSDCTIKIWDIETGSLVRTLTGHLVGVGVASADSEASRNENRVLSIDYSLDGQLFVSSSGDETLKLWNAITGECLHTYQVLPPYAGMDITGVTGLTAATIAGLKTLGAIDRFPVLSGC
jgi:WD40 repeat protein